MQGRRLSPKQEKLAKDFERGVRFLPLGRYGKSRVEEEIIAACGNSTRCSRDPCEDPEGRARVRGRTTAYKASARICRKESCPHGRSLIPPMFKSLLGGRDGDRCSGTVKHSPHPGHKPEWRCAGPVWCTSRFGGSRPLYSHKRPRRPRRKPTHCRIQNKGGVFTEVTGKPDMVDFQVGYFI